MSSQAGFVGAGSTGVNPPNDSLSIVHLPPPPDLDPKSNPATALDERSELNELNALKFYVRQMTASNSRKRRRFVLILPIRGALLTWIHSFLLKEPRIKEVVVVISLSHLLKDMIPWLLKFVSVMRRQKPGVQMALLIRISDSDSDADVDANANFEHPTEDVEWNLFILRKVFDQVDRVSGVYHKFHYWFENTLKQIRCCEFSADFGLADIVSIGVKKIVFKIHPKKYHGDQWCIHPVWTDIGLFSTQLRAYSQLHISGLESILVDVAHKEWQYSTLTGLIRTRIPLKSLHLRNLGEAVFFDQRFPDQFSETDQPPPLQLDRLSFSMGPFLEDYMFKESQREAFQMLIDTIVRTYQIRRVDLYNTLSCVSEYLFARHVEVHGYQIEHVRIGTTAIHCYAFHGERGYRNKLGGFPGRLTSLCCRHIMSAKHVQLLTEQIEHVEDKLELHINLPHDITFPLFQGILDKCYGLRRLSIISDEKFGLEDWPYLGNILTPWVKDSLPSIQRAKIRELNLQLPYAVDISFLTMLFDGVETTQSLDILEIAFQLDHRCALYILGRLGKNRTLTRFVSLASPVQMGPEGVRAITKIFKSNTFIEQVDMQICLRTPRDTCYAYHWLLSEMKTSKLSWSGLDIDDQHSLQLYADREWELRVTRDVDLDVEVRVAMVCGGLRTTSAPMRKLWFVDAFRMIWSYYSSGAKSISDSNMDTDPDSDTWYGDEDCNWWA